MIRDRDSSASREPSAFVRRCRRYCLARRISLSTLGYYAVGNSRLFASLERGKSCTIRTIDRVLSYIDEHPTDTTPQSGGNARSAIEVNGVGAAHK